jgi:hypothetical protein
MSDLLMCPECRAGKCVNCTTVTLDPDKDEMGPCGCTHGDNPHDGWSYDLTTPRMYTARGGWNVSCACGVGIGESGDEDLAERHRAHVATMGGWLDVEDPDRNP